MRATAKASANIAFIKYWGKRNADLRIPMNNSISMNLSNVYAQTSVEFNKNLTRDVVTIDGETLKDKENKRVIKHLDRVRKIAGNKLKAKVISNNNFPKGTGVASSASGFAALTCAVTKALELSLSEKELSILARLGSGSACRSIPDGFVEWKAGRTSKGSYAHSLYPPKYWDIRDIVVIVGEKEKKVSSTKGHSVSGSSLFFDTRLSKMREKVKEIKKAMKDRDFSKLGEIIEAEAINMHAVMMTSKPALFYWLPETVEIINSIIKWREQGLELYFTLDAGPNVHVICLGKNVARVKRYLSSVKGVKRIIVNKPSVGARLIG